MSEQAAVGSTMTWTAEERNALDAAFKRASAKHGHYETLFAVASEALRLRGSKHIATCDDKECHRDREFNMAIVAKDESGKPSIWCDPCLVPLIKALNGAGVKTVASCCGHREREGSVLLADGTEIKLPRRGA